MQKFYAMAVMTAMLVGATSCSNDDEMATPEGPEQSRSLIVENVGVSALTRSGITANSFTSGETLGLYIYRGNGIAEAYNDASSTISTVNVPYVQGADGWSATQPIILSSVVGKVYSYYPYAAGNDTQDGAAIPVSVAANQGTGQSDGVKDVTEQSGAALVYADYDKCGWQSDSRRYAHKRGLRIIPCKYDVSLVYFF
uniref:fimbrillin family protein n=1 Tax=Bacteroides fragilis TaxID=817 RepID=UPI0035638C46